MVCLGVERFRGGGKAVEVPNTGEWQCTFCGAAHCWNTRLSCYRCGTLRNWQSGGEFRREWLARGLVLVCFFGQGRVGSAMGGRVGSAQLVVVRRTCRKVSPLSGRVVMLMVGEECGRSWCWCWLGQVCSQRD